MLVKVKDFFAFLYLCKEKKILGVTQVILPVKSKFGNDGYNLAELDKEGEYVIDSYRAIDPVKILFYAPREKVYPEDEAGVKRIVAGVKDCDLRGLKLLDKALINENFVDPVYKKWRDDTIVITSDCMEIAPSCHCNLVGGKPYSEDGYDLNLSRVGDSYLVKVGSDKGERLVGEMRRYIKVESSSDEIEKLVEDNRASVLKRLEENNKDFERGTDYERMREISIEAWKEESRDCVGCGGCNNICPTCYCVILNDESKDKDFTKVRSYDSCQLTGYARVAGGANPRPKMYQRFRNRYLCKFLYMKYNFDLLGCTGCGRCIDVCPGEIEFRGVVKRIMEKEKGFQEA